MEKVNLFLFNSYGKVYSFLRNQKGQGMFEYLGIAAAVAIPLILLVPYAREKVQTLFKSIFEQLSSGLGK